MPFVSPYDARSPKRMTLVQVLVAGADERDPSYALQLWESDDGEPSYGVGARWNGDDDRPIGTPNINGNPCWFVLDSRLWPAVLTMVEDPALRREAAEKLYASGPIPDSGAAALRQEPEGD